MGAGDLNNPDKVAASKRKVPNVLSRLFICWICPVLFKGNRKDLEEDDLIAPYHGNIYDSASLGQKLEKYWLEELEYALQKDRQPSLWKALSRAFWLSYMPAAIFVGLNMIARTVQPLVFAQLLSYWSVDNNKTWQEACYWGLGLIGLNFIAMMSQHHNNQFVGRFGLKVRIACSSLLYRKLLRLNQSSIQKVAAGKIVNLMSNDMARFDFAFMFMHYIWMIPIQVGVALYFLYNAAGWAPFVGLFSYTIVILPLQAVLTKLTAVTRRKTAIRSDKRIKLMSEIINGIQVIKMYAWEIPFQRAVKAARSNEMSYLKKALFIQGTFGGFMLFSERTSMFLTILTLALTGSMITATLVYPVQQYFSILQSNLALILPLAIASISEMFVTIERLEEFLVLDEREDLSLMPKAATKLSRNIFNSKTDNVSNYILPKSYSKKDEVWSLSKEPAFISPLPKTTTSEFAIELNNVSASWTGSRDQLTLRNLSLRVRRGKLCAVIGSVGAGKSSLLQLLIKELPVSKGTLQVNGSISYACQESWLYSGTVRENIIFGLPYDAEKYNKVCKSCCLKPDFKQFPYGDLSLVGERGVSLSGGQRARITLARAVYREADVYLLDDPLSAVDANVGRQLFEGCMKGYLRGRTCILVTHQIHFLMAADYIVVLNEGSVEDMGTYDDLIKSDKELSILRYHVQESTQDKENEILQKRPSLDRGMSVISSKSDQIDDIQKEQIQAAEERAKGNLKFAVFYRYIKSVRSWPMVALTIFALIITQAAASGTDYWISFWTNQVNSYYQTLNNQEPDPSLSTQIGPLTNGQYLIVHGSLVVGVILFSFARLGAYVVTLMRAATNIHDVMFRNLIRATMRFFDTQPSGRVLNRFSKDMGGMDELLPRSLLQSVQLYLSIISVLILNALSLWWTLIPTVALLTGFILFMRWYLNAGQAVKRLEGTTKSPIFGMINSTIEGLPTIRCSEAQNRLVSTFDSHQNQNSNAFFTYLGGSCAFALYLDMFCLIYLSIILSIFIFIDFDDLIPVGSVGLAVTQSMVLTMLLQMSARFTAEFLAQMTAVERVLEYTSLPLENNIDDGPRTPPDNWPTAGNVIFEHLYLQYGLEDPPVLKGINFNIKSGWKVGVVGRTGAGKSSLISALFRLTNIQGKIIIDGFDTADVALQVLRSKISIIPQEPVLFSASLRYNLDPFDNYSDDQIWAALEQVELKEAVPALDFKIAEGGTNFSVGQRQLVCLARALLRSNKILIMDEATANVDPQTDLLIQRTIRRQFQACTVITIAHRLNTIMDSDMVLVMESGEAKEFDHPHTLLSDQNSRFSFMVGETGDAMSKALKEIAKHKYNEKLVKITDIVA